MTEIVSSSLSSKEHHNVNKNHKNYKLEYMKSSNSDYLSFDSEHRLRAENLSFDIDVWYPLVEKHTFRSMFLPLKLKEAIAIRAFHDVSWRHVKQCLSDDEISTLITLEKDIDDKLMECFPNREAFIRMCGRSPKDGEPRDRDKIRRSYHKMLSEYKALGTYGEEEAKMLAIAKTPLLHVRCGADVMSLLLTSERVYSDMIDWIKFGEPEQICLREYDPRVTIDNEYRVFVYENKLTAVSQYDHYGYYRHIEPNREKILCAINKVWKEVHALLKVSSYVMDVAIIPSNEHGDDTCSSPDQPVFECLVVEFSPFFYCTGSSLFSWTADIDILQGIDPFEFRTKKQADLHPQLADLIDVNWDSRWVGEAVPYESFFNKEPGTELSTVRDDSVTKGKYILLGSCWSLLLFSYLSGGLDLVPVSRESYDPVVLLQELVHRLPPPATLGPIVASVLLFAYSRLYLHPNLKAGAGVKTKAATIIGDCNSSDRRDGGKSRKDDGQRNAIKLFVYGTLKRGFQWNNKYLSQRLGATFVSEATTCSSFRLVVGDCGVPYLLLNDEEEHLQAGDGLKHETTTTAGLNATTAPIDTPGSRSDHGVNINANCVSNIQEKGKGGYCIKGELWEVTEECLQNLDDYEGISKGYYERCKVRVRRRVSESGEYGEEEEEEANVYILRVLVNGVDGDLLTKPCIDEYTLSMHKQLYSPVNHIQIKQVNYFKTPSSWGKSREAKL